MIECVRRTSRNVKRWQSGDMALRWTVAGMLEAEQQFRRVIGYRDLAKLAVAVERDLTAKTVSSSTAEEAATLVTAWPFTPGPSSRSSTTIGTSSDVASAPLAARRPNAHVRGDRRFPRQRLSRGLRNSHHPKSKPTGTRVRFPPSRRQPRSRPLCGFSALAGSVRADGPGQGRRQPLRFAHGSERLQQLTPACRDRLWSNPNVRREERWCDCSRRIPSARQPKTDTSIFWLRLPQVL